MRYKGRTVVAMKEVFLSIVAITFFVVGGLVPQTHPGIGCLEFRRRVVDDGGIRLDVDDPVAVGFPNKTIEDGLNFEIRFLEIDINNWHRYLQEKSTYQRRCDTILLSDRVMLFRCTVQVWYGDRTSGPSMVLYGLNPQTGGWMDAENVKSWATLNGTLSHYPGVLETIYVP